jgi:hypothetical protein
MPFLAMIVLIIMSVLLHAAPAGLRTGRGDTGRDRKFFRQKNAAPAGPGRRVSPYDVRLFGSDLVLLESRDSGCPQQFR